MFPDRRQFFFSQRRELIVGMCTDFFQENRLSSVWQKFKPFVCASICQQTVLNCVSLVIGILFEKPRDFILHNLRSCSLSLTLLSLQTSHTLLDTHPLHIWPSPALNNPSSLTHPTLTPKSHTLLDTLLLYLTLTYFISDPHQLSTILRALTPTCSHSNLSHSLGHSPTPDVLTLTSSYHWFLIQCALSRSFSFPLDLTLLL